MRVIAAIALLVVVTAAAVLFAAAPQAAPSKFFPYPVHKRTLPNGLDVVVIETPEFKDVLSFNTLMLAGSRNETAKGQTGLAHLFEHILFRHRYQGVPDGYTEAMRQLGTHNNAWTYFDVTYYHPLTFASNLERLAELEGSRFTSLDFDEKIFQTETGAVLGEYRRVSSDPREKMEEKLFAATFQRHPYGHTTIGFYEDVLEMPKHYKDAVEFYRRYYRPNNAVVVVSGDVKRDQVFAAVEKHYGKWQRADVPVVPPEAPGTGPKREHVEWQAEVAPRVFVSYRMPPFRPTERDSAVGQILPELLVSRSAPLYQRLRFEKQLVSELEFHEGTRGYESFDPRFVIVAAQLFGERYTKEGKAYLDQVANEIAAGMDELKKYSSVKDAAPQLEVLKSKYRYDFLAEFSSPANIAETFALFYRFDRDPEVLEKLVGSVSKLTPRDFDEFTQKYFTPQTRVVVTMAQK